MKRLRIFALMHEELVPPEDMEGVEDYTKEPWKTEFDVMATLGELGHEVRALGVRGDLGVIRDNLDEAKPHIVFNLLEEFDGLALYDQNVVAYLELLGVRYTGCNPRGLMLARDKALSKKILNYHRIGVPRFAVFRRGRKVRRPRRLEFPLFVKSLVEEASLGISQQSKVEDDGDLVERVAFIHESVGSDAIAEEYIAGRELYVGVLGNERLEVFPPWELVIRKQADDVPVIATRKVKWDLAYQKRMGVDTCEAKGLSPEQGEHIKRTSKRIFRILELSGYARMDFRLSEEGRLYFLEANPNPQLAYGEDFAESAEKKGISYNELVKRILSLGLRRARAER